MAISMKILANRKIKSLFGQILTAVSVFAAVSVCIIKLESERAALYILMCSLCMALAILIACYIYISASRTGSWKMPRHRSQNTFQEIGIYALSVMMRESCTGCSTR